MIVPTALTVLRVRDALIRMIYVLARQSRLFAIVVVSVGRRVLPAVDTETAAFLLWFAAIQCIESKQDLAGLAPKDCFIPAKPIERVAGQIG